MVRTRLYKFFRTLGRQRIYLYMSIPLLIYIIIFRYLPIWGWTMAFQNYKPSLAFSEQTWVGLRHFKFLFQEEYFFLALRNTMAMSLLNMIFGFGCAITLSLMINEIRSMRFKKLTQTVSYVPHFVSMVVVAGLVQTILAEGGAFNDLLMALGLIDKPIIWMGEGKHFWLIIAITHVWKEVGWNTIIYLASITSIDPSLYEAASIDGAGRFKKIRYITLPGMKATIIILLIMNIGRVMDMGFELQYLLYNEPVKKFAEVIETFVIRYGLSRGNYSFATAAGIFKSVVGIVLVLGANKLAKALGEEGIM